MYQIVAGILIASAIATASYFAGQSGAGDAGYRQGDADGYKRGVQRTNELRDKELRAYIAEAREAAEKARADGFQKALEQERARQDEVQRAAQRYADDARKLATANRSLADRVRRLQARDPAASSSDPVPGADQSPGGDVGPTDPAGLLYEADRRMVEESGAADYEAGRFLSCHRWVYSKDQVRTTEASE